MKRLLLLALYLLLLTALFASVAMPEEIEEPVRSIINDSIERSIRGRGAIDFSIEDYLYEELDDNIHVSFKLIFLDKSLPFEVIARDMKALNRVIPEEIDRLLFYEDALFSDSDEVLDYIYSGSYSFFPKKEYRRGSVLVARDNDNRIRGVFEVNHKYTDVYDLQPVYLSNAKPGMALDRSSSWYYAMQGATNFYSNSFSISAEVGNTSLIYPFSPVFSLVYEMAKGSYAIYGGIGIEAYADLNDFINTSFTLIQEGRIGASASLLLGVENGSFSYNGVYSIFYEHRLLPKLMWRVGYAKYPLLGHSLVVGIGGSF